MSKRVSDEARSRRDKARYDRLKDSGLCVDCRKPLKGASVRCVACLEYRSCKSREWQQDHIAKGLCIRCSAPARKGQQTCAKHRYQAGRGAPCASEKVSKCRICTSRAPTRAKER